LLFWGDVGTGKSFTAACIANELIQREQSVIMTSFVKILQDLWDKKTDEQGYMAKFERVSLLIIDDLGAERNTDYALEKVYNVIDSRYRSGKPMILTTNLSLSEIMDTMDMRYKRVYDRILEICYPVHAVGKSFRITEAAKRFDEMKQYFQEEEDGQG
jgi:DNA replication protein DnaC